MFIPGYFKKIYLSRAMTRMMSMDGPVGDPFGGPAFGERRDPVSAVVAFVEVATAFEMIAAIGTAISIVGMVTGNEDMTKIGGVMGLVGGFGAMAQNGVFGETLKGWASEVNNTFSSTASNISATATPVNPETITQSTVPTVETGSASASIAPQTELNLAQAPGASVDTSGMLAPGASVDTASTGLINDPAVLGDGTAVGINSTSAPVDGAIATSTNPAIDIAKAGEPINRMQAVAQQGGNLSAVKAAASGGIDTGASLWDKVSSFVKDNKELSQVAMTGIAGMYQSDEKTDLLKAQASNQRAMTDLYGARTAEMQSQQSNANAIANVGGMKVNPNANVYKSQPIVSAPVISSGLIQTRRT